MARGAGLIVLSAVLAAAAAAPAAPGVLTVDISACWNGTKAAPVRLPIAGRPRELQLVFTGQPSALQEALPWAWADVGFDFFVEGPGGEREPALADDLLALESVTAAELLERFQGVKKSAESKDEGFTERVSSRVRGWVDPLGVFNGGRGPISDAALALLAQASSSIDSDADAARAKEQLTGALFAMLNGRRDANTLWLNPFANTTLLLHARGLGAAARNASASAALGSHSLFHSAQCRVNRVAMRYPVSLAAGLLLSHFATSIATDPTVLTLTSGVAGILSVFVVVYFLLYRNAGMKSAFTLTALGGFLTAAGPEVLRVVPGGDALVLEPQWVLLGVLVLGALCALFLLKNDTARPMFQSALTWGLHLAGAGLVYRSFAYPTLQLLATGGFLFLLNVVPLILRALWSALSALFAAFEAIERAVNFVLAWTIGWCWRPAPRFTRIASCRVRWRCRARTPEEEAEHAAETGLPAPLPGAVPVPLAPGHPHGLPHLPPGASPAGYHYPPGALEAMAMAHAQAQAAAAL